MKLLSILAISADATSFNEAFNNDVSMLRSVALNQYIQPPTETTTSWDDALAILKNRYIDLELEQYDTPDRFLKKSTMKLWRMMKNKRNRRVRKGCWVSGTKTGWDLSLDAWEKCDYSNTLLEDIQAGVVFFLGDDPMEAFMNDQIPEECKRFYDKFENHFHQLLSWLHANWVTPLCMG